VNFRMVYKIAGISGNSGPCMLRPEFGHSMTTNGERDINKAVIGLLWTAPGDNGGRGQV